MIIDINNLDKSLEFDDIFLLVYEDMLSQFLIADLTADLEDKIEELGIPIGLANNLFVIFIELAQNMLLYSSIEKTGIIIMAKNTKTDEYYIFSQSVITKDDKEKIEPRLEVIIDSSKDDIKKLYKEARRSGKNTHAKGGGLGFLEMAKRGERVDYEFFPKANNAYYFQFRVILKEKKKLR